MMRADTPAMDRSLDLATSQIRARDAYGMRFTSTPMLARFYPLDLSCGLWRDLHN